MPLITNYLKEIIETHVPDSVYMRATEIDANIDLDQIDLEGKTICIYENLPEVVNTRTGQNSFVQRAWPVVIHILKLAELDDNTIDGDSLREVCIEAADIIFDRLETDMRLSLINAVESYSFTMEGSVKYFDKILTGLKMGFEVPVDRETYNC